MELLEKAEMLGRPRASAGKNNRKEAKRTEELEEAGCRFPTWAVLRLIEADQ